MNRIILISRLCVAGPSGGAAMFERILPEKVAKQLLSETKNPRSNSSPGDSP